MTAGRAERAVRAERVGRVAAAVRGSRDGVEADGGGAMSTEGVIEDEGPAAVADEVADEEVLAMVGGGEGKRHRKNRPLTGPRSQRPRKAQQTSQRRLRVKRHLKKKRKTHRRRRP